MRSKNVAVLMCCKIRNGWATHDVLMAVALRSVVFWEVLPYTLTTKYQIFGRIKT